ncbi:ran GTPase activating protein 1 [Cordyceps militaris CM01]|uniref:Ran GTPase activating protein 1 n=2 Tax=Cordyceps militaris TaxID=73501 RepID=G3JLT0_CORMM|nr:ran GTPase activating protein 1 [Cordyceps militaris CM01]ATY62445.1 ran GTPase activating 1 [Cordyceps militaris]EGX90654.1 ran GTPase activating protein 1 [Cordyceps militaris CM01]
MVDSKKIFSLEGKGLKLTTAADVEPHIAALRANDVEEVHLLGNSLGIEACKVLGEVLATKKNLQVANLADIFTARLLSEIPDALSHLLTSILNLPKLHTLNVNDNAFGLNTQAPLVAFLAAHVPLQHLYLNNNGLGPHAGILIADALSSLHAKKEAARAAGQTVPDLETVICGRNRLENGSMTAWAKTYRLHSKLRVVKMVQNGIRQEGISHLLREGLLHATDLQALDLQDNTFTLRGSQALAAVAPKWASLRELAVGDCLLGGKGAVLVAAALAQGKNAKLETLRLQFNDMTPAGVEGFAKAAKNLPALKRIELNGNKFEEEDASVTVLQELLEERKEAVGGDLIVEDEWGVDELDELEGFDSDEEEEEEEVTPDERAEKLIKEAEEAQEEPTVQLQDKNVDELAKKLEKTGI